MTTFKKYFPTIAKAEAFLSRLYCRYEHARVIAWPPHFEAGEYTFEIDKPIK